ncbi:MAG: hypothetical protein ACYDB7_02960 [Mycobacteriales bacterium]
MTSLNAPFAFSEIKRVLRPGGEFLVADTFTDFVAAGAPQLALLAQGGFLLVASGREGAGSWGLFTGAADGR